MKFFISAARYLSRPLAYCIVLYIFHPFTCASYTPLPFPPILSPAKPYNSTTIQDPTRYIKLGPWYALERGFMNIFQPQPFRIEQMVDLYNGRFKVEQLGQSNVIGIVILVLIGLLYALGLLVSCLVTICGQTCHPTILKPKYDPEGQRKLQSSLSCFTMTVCFLMAGSCALLLLSVMEFQRIWKNSDEVVDTALTDVKAFLSNINDQVFADNQSCLGDYSTLQSKIKSELTVYGSTIGEQLKESFANGRASEYSSLVNAISTFGERTNAFIAFLNGVPDQMEVLNKAVRDLESILTDAKTIDDSIMKQDCIKIFPCWALYGAFWPIADTDIVKNLFMEFPGLVKAARGAFNNISVELEPSQGIAKSITDLLKSQKTAIDKLMMKLEQLRACLQYALDPLQLDAVLGLGDKMEEYRLQYKKVKTYPVDKYLMYATIGVLVWVAVIVLAITTGILCGAANFKPDRLPSERHGASARGGVILTYALVIMQVFSWALMLGVTIMMVAVTQVEKAGCFVLENEAANFSDLRTAFTAINNSITPMELKFNNKSLDLADVLGTCLHNGSAWKALKLSLVLNVTDCRICLTAVNISEALAEFRVDPAKIRIADAQMLSAINNMLDKAKNMYNAKYIKDTYAKFRYWYNTGNNSRPMNDSSPRLGKNTGKGLLGYIVPKENSPVEDYYYDYEIWNENYWSHAAKYATPYQPYTLYYNSMMNYSQTIQFPDGEQAWVNILYQGGFVELDKINTSPPGMSAVLLVQKNITRDLLLAIEPIMKAWLTQAETVITAAKTLQTALQASKGDMDVGMIVRRFTDRLYNYTLDYVTFLEQCLTEDAGRCRPIYDAFHIVAHLACDAILPPVNFLWFTIGLTLVVQGPTILLVNRLKGFYAKGGELFPHKESVSWAGSEQNINEEAEVAVLPNSPVTVRFFNARA